MSSSNFKLPAINHRKTPTGSQNESNLSPSQRELSKSTSLAIVRAKRKQVEESAHLLNNRVLVLEHEQEKLIKVTKDTKEKTSSMLKHRVEREETQKNLREMTRKMKELAQQSYQEKRQKVLDMQRQNHQERDFQRNQQIELIRLQKEMNLRRLQEIKERTLAENRIKREKVKHLKQVAEQNVSEFFNRRLDHFARERERMIQEEERLIREKEELIKALSCREDKLLNEVDEHQMKVRQAHVEFEDLNHLETDEFVNRHSEYLQVISPQQNKSLNKSVISSKSFTSSKANKKVVKAEKTSPKNEVIENSKEQDAPQFEQDQPQKEGETGDQQQTSPKNNQQEGQVEEGRNSPQNNEQVVKKEIDVSKNNDLDIDNDKSIL